MSLQSDVTVYPQNNVGYFAPKKFHQKNFVTFLENSSSRRLSSAMTRSASVWVTGDVGETVPDFLPNNFDERFGDEVSVFELRVFELKVFEIKLCLPSMLFRCS